MRIKTTDCYNCIVYFGKQLRRIRGAKAVYSCMMSHDLIKVMSGAILDAIITRDHLEVSEQDFYHLADTLSELILKFRAENLPLNSEQAINSSLTQLSPGGKSSAVVDSLLDLYVKDGDEL